MPSGAQEGVGLGLEVLHGDAGKGLQHPGGQHRQLAVVALVVPGYEVAQPAVVLVIGGLPGLARAQLGVLVGHGGQAAQDEVELDRHRLLAPQRAVVVEDGHQLLRRNEAGGALVTRSTNARIASLVAPSFQEARGSSPWGEAIANLQGLSMRPAAPRSPCDGGGCAVLTRAG
jgi:hypothetical protein